MKKLELWITPTAKAKLKEIYTYSCKKWGQDTAKKYLGALENAMRSVANGTKHTKINPNFSTRFAYCSCQRHIIFFEYQHNKLIVASIFHASMSVKERLAEEMPSLERDIKSHSK